jgi:hypothetical protein
MKKKDPNVSATVPIARRRRYSPTSSPRKRWEMVVKKTALRPKAASGKAVAVPRWRGQLSAAVQCQDQYV